MLSRMLRARPASRLAALALSNKLGGGGISSAVAHQACQCEFWIPVPTTTW